MILNRNDISLAGGVWVDIAVVPKLTYTCGYCGDIVASDRGWTGSRPNVGPSLYIRVCPSCDGPSLFTPSGNTESVSQAQVRNGVQLRPKPPSSSSYRVLYPTATTLLHGPFHHNAFAAL